ncbi:MAG TPA: hypothetical protein VMU84_00805 [Thermoanaerobaculia bacterium]|nr:hypothetical protein [Thermoanaerobaculia bacterium]
MENRDKDLNKNKNIGNTNLDKDKDVSQGGFGSSTGRSGSIGNMGGGGSDTPRRNDRSGDLDKSSDVSGSEHE